MGDRFVDPNTVEIGIGSNYDVPADNTGDDFLEELNICTSEFLVSYDWYLILIAVGLLLFGLFLTLSGYRAFRFCMWFAGALFATVAVLGICNRVDDLPRGANWGAALAVGSLAGCVTHLLPGIGAFLWGVYSGAVLSGVVISILVATGTFIPSPVGSASLCILVGGNLCGAFILMRHWSKPGLVLATSFCGALLITSGVDYFIEEWRLLNYVWYELLNLAPTPERKAIPCWYSYCILGLWPIFTGLGIFTQRMATARKYKQKVERVHVPQTAVTVYDTIRRTIDRQRTRQRNIDQYMVQGPVEQSRNSRNPLAGSSQIASRASRNRDRARQQRQSRHEQSSQPDNSNVRHNSDRQRLLNVNAPDNSRQNQRLKQPNRGQVRLLPIRIIQEHYLYFSE